MGHHPGVTGSRWSGHSHGAATAVLPGVLIATALTAWRYSAKPLWRDEWITWSVTARPWGSMTELLSTRDGGFWPFYALVHAWAALGRAIGVDPAVTPLSVAWLRLPAALATVLAVAATALVARRVGGPLVGALAGVLTAVVPAVVDHAQEARAYPEVAAAVALTALAALRCREPGVTGRWVALAVVAVLAVAVHPLPGVPAVVGVLAALLVSPGVASRRRVVVAGLPAAVVSAALIGVGASQVGLVLTDDPGGWSTIADFRLVLAPGWALLAVMAALGVVGALSLRRSDRGAALLLTAWALVPPLVLAALVVTGSFSTRRYLVAAAPAVCVLVALGAVALARATASRSTSHGVAIAVATAVVAVVVAGLVPHALAARQAPYRVDDPRSAARYLSASYRSGDAVVYAGPFARGLTTSYAPEAPALPDTLLVRGRLASETVDGVDVAPARQASAVAGAPRVWVVATLAGRATEGQDVVDRTTAGRDLLSRERFGAVVVGLWGPAGG